MKKREHIIETSGKSIGKICTICKGDKLLCGKSECPILAKYRSLIKVRNKLKEDIQGSSPPSIFVGRNGYPKVNVGPMVPPYIGSTEIFDLPESWISLDIHKFIDIRMSLVRAKKRVNVQDIENRYVRSLQEIILSERPVLIEEKFIKRPSYSIQLGDEIPPYGASGDLEIMYPHFESTNFKIEKIYEDTELMATEAMFKLYKEGVRISTIQKVLSAGMLGLKSYRKLVPTRWAITAVDSTISELNLERIKEYETIDKIEVYESREMENIFVIVLFPRAWAYELVEGWYPGTLWNPFSSEIFIISDHEFNRGRKDYAEIGGCYYSARLAVTEMLERRKRQAMALVLREALPSYILPVGVWNVRENVRNALLKTPIIFDNEKDAFNYIFSKFHLPKEEWIRNSKLLDFIFHQRFFDEML